MGYFECVTVQLAKLVLARLPSLIVLMSRPGVRSIWLFLPNMDSEPKFFLQLAATNFDGNETGNIGICRWHQPGPPQPALKA